MGRRGGTTLIGAVGLAMLLLGTFLPAGTAAPGSAVAPRIRVTLPHLHVFPASHAAKASSSSSTDLVYNHGPVEVGPTKTYAIFWEPTGSGVSPTYNSLIVQFLKDLGGTTDYGVTSQYFEVADGVQRAIKNRSTFAGSWVDTTSYPLIVSETDIAGAIDRAMLANKWERGSNNNFLVFTGPSAITCTGLLGPLGCPPIPYCAYHGYDVSQSQPLLFANMPYPKDAIFGGCTIPASPNNDLAADSAINFVNHELLEMVTDPLGSGWSAPDGSENGDLCNFTFGDIGTDHANLKVKDHKYLVQQTWSNMKHACAN